MGFLVPVIVIALGLASSLLVEISAELSTDVLLETDTGIGFAAPNVVSDPVVDLRPETSLDTRVVPASVQSAW